MGGGRGVDGPIGWNGDAVRLPTVPVPGITEGRSPLEAALGARSGIARWLAGRTDGSHGVNFHSRL